MKTNDTMVQSNKCRVIDDIGHPVLGRSGICMSMVSVFENMVLRRIFGPSRDEVTREWRRMHNEELNDLYCSPNIVRVINREE